MAISITGIPSTRITESFTRDQILRQSQANQLAISQLEDQLSSGYAFQVPSEDPIAAMQVISLQRLLQQKDQVKSNVTTTQSYLSATDTSLSSVNGILTNALTTAESVVGTTATATQLRTAAVQIQQTIQQILSTGNQQFQGRYLFSGSESINAPFQQNSAGLIAYLGNNQHLMSYSNVNQLTSSNVTGNEAFGVISSEVKGTQTITPTLTYDTQLADLRQGEGISKGSIVISDGTKNPDGSPNESIIDLSGAKTIGDVAALIEANPPKGRQLYVDVTADKLTIQLDSQGGGNLTIGEVGSGTVAQELGIRNETGAGVGPIIGSALEPILRTTTSLDNLFGSYASTVVHSSGTDNDIRLKADVMGAQTTVGGTTVNLNGINVVYQPDNAIVAGNEYVDPVQNGTLTVHVAADGSSRAYQVVNAINAAHQAGTIPFTADIDPLDNVHGGFGFVESNAAATTRDGAGEPFDKTDGLQIVNNNKVQTVDFSAAKTVGDVLNILNGSGAGVLAQINQAQNGIDLLSNVSGCDFEVGENGGNTAAQLGVRSFKVLSDDPDPTQDNSTPLSSLNYGRGVGIAANSTAIMAQAAFASNVKNAGFTVTAKNSAGDPGADYWNNFSVTLTNTGDDPPTVQYDKVHRTLTVGIDPGVTTAQDVLTAVSGSVPPTDFQVSLANNADGSTSDGSGLVATGVAFTQGGTPQQNDFVITASDGTNLYIDLSQETTVQGVIDQINGNSSNNNKILAQPNAYGNGIELVDLSGGKGTTTITQNRYSTAAVDLGLIPSGRTQNSSIVPGHSVTFDVAPQSRIVIQGQTPNTPVNGVDVKLVQAPTAGVVYDPSAHTLTVSYTNGMTTQNVVDEINNSAYHSLFNAALAPIPNDGTGAVANCQIEMSGANATNNSSAATDFAAGNNSNLTFTANQFANQNGDSYNNVQIQFTGVAGGPGGVPGAINFARTGNVITVNYDSNTPPTANQISAGWGVAANWVQDDHNPPTRNEVDVALDPSDTTASLGTAAMTDQEGIIQPQTTGQTVINGADVNPQETQGVFTALLRMQDAMMNNNQQELQRSVDILNKATTNLNYTRAELGAREQGLANVQSGLDSEYVDLQTSLSNVHDVDFVQVVSDLSARQTAYQASLMTLGKIMQMSLINYM